MNDWKDPDNLLDALNEVFGPENVFVFGFEDEAGHRLDWNVRAEMPPEEEIDSQEWKLLFMLLCENSAKHDYTAGLTPYGVQVLRSIQRKLGINVVGVDINDTIG